MRYVNRHKRLPRQPRLHAERLEDRSLLSNTPALDFSTFVAGNSMDWATDVALDSNGNIYIVGTTASWVDFQLAPISYTVMGRKLVPVIEAAQPSFGGPMEDETSIEGDVFVMKLDPTGTNLIYSTFLGGSGADYGVGIAVDNAGNAYVTGATYSFDFPTTEGAYDRTYGRGEVSIGDAFVTKINPTGTAIVFSTLLGGNEGIGGEGAEDIAVDSAGNVYITGSTGTPDFPTRNAAQPTYAGGLDAFVSKLNSTGSDLIYSTYLGGRGKPHEDFDVGYGIEVDDEGNAYVVGGTRAPDFPVKDAVRAKLRGSSDAFFAKFDANGTLLVSTYLGGSSYDVAQDLSLDAAGNVLISGTTASPDNATPGAPQQTRGDCAVGSGLAASAYCVTDSRGQAVSNTSIAVPQGSTPECPGIICSDAFVMKLSAGGYDVEYSTYLGGVDIDQGGHIAADANGNAFVTGTTHSRNFPLANAIQSTFTAGCSFSTFYQTTLCPSNSFVTKLGSNGAVEFSTLFGGRSGAINGITLDPAGSVIVVGRTDGVNFPLVDARQTVYGGYVSDGFLAKIALESDQMTQPAPADNHAPPQTAVVPQTRSSKPNRINRARDLVPPGNVIVTVSSGRLLITGDNADNHLRISASAVNANTLLITPGAGTRINGQTAAVEFSNVTAGLRVRLLGGNDTLTLDGSTTPLSIPGALDMRREPGTDTVELIDSVLIATPPSRWGKTALRNAMGRRVLEF
jgi:hypothetical protein